MAETLRNFGFANVWPDMTCVPLQILVVDNAGKFYAVEPGKGFPVGLLEGDWKIPTAEKMRSAESFVSSEGTPYEMKDWREGQVAYLDRHGNPRVDKWENLIPIMKQDLPYVAGDEHRRLLEKMLREPA